MERASGISLKPKLESSALPHWATGGEWRAINARFKPCKPSIQNTYPQPTARDPASKRFAKGDSSPLITPTNYRVTPSIGKRPFNCSNDSFPKIGRSGPSPHHRIHGNVNSSPDVSPTEPSPTFSSEPMKPTHTPGPWHLVSHRPKLVKVETARVVICDSFGGLSDETMANAHLIACAPDLLSALERLTHPMADDEDLEYARAIISKAKGQR